MHRLTLIGFLGRWIFALVLVLATFNPSRWCYVGWIIYGDLSYNFWAKMAVGLVLTLLLAIYYHATRIALGQFGVICILVLYGALIGQLTEWGWLDPYDPSVMAWLALAVMSLIMALGMSWSHIQRRLTGQLDFEDWD